MDAHYLDDGTDIDASSLAQDGVRYQSLPIDEAAWRSPIEALMAREGYLHQDEISLRPDTPNLESLCARFVEEHHHSEDEVRFVLEGESVFDIRSRADRWMRVTVRPGDLIVVPKERHHRFFLTDIRMIRCVRLFQDRAG